VVISLTNDEFTPGSRWMGNGSWPRAGARLKAIVGMAARHQLSGLEFMEGIPGSLGGALRMNAGAMGKQMFDVVEWVRYISYAGDTV
jgi:UDP-N-acetylmuramate--alanine ligase